MTDREFIKEVEERTLRRLEKTEGAGLYIDAESPSRAVRKRISTTCTRLVTVVGSVYWTVARDEMLEELGL